MEKHEIQKRMAELAGELKEHSRLYYQEVSPAISDAEYDRLFHELEDLEAKYPLLAPPDSPTRRVGAQPSPSFAPVEHQRPMLSLDSSADEKVVHTFLGRLERIGAKGAELLVQPKIDGLSIELVYENGRLAVASTRGDGRVGEDVTPNIRQMVREPGEADEDDEDKIPDPLKGDPPAKVVVRGEVYMGREEFQRLNRQLVEDGREPFSNPRNAAAGSLRQKDSTVTKERPLAFFPFELMNAEDLGYATDRESLLALHELGFESVKSAQLKTARILEELEHYHFEFMRDRESLTYEIDGMVIKLDDFGLRAQLPSTTRTPLWAVAWKFPPRQKETTVRDIVHQVGRTGKITPVALLDPVDVGGATVSRATLHNMDEIKRLGIRLGDKVRVVRSGDVIPKIVEVLKGPLEKPKVCPSCGTTLEPSRSLTKDFKRQASVDIMGKKLRVSLEEPGHQTKAVLEIEGADLVCPNTMGCPAQIEASIQHFAGRQAMDIEGLGPERVRTLRELGFITGVASLYRLAEREAELAALPGWGEVSARNLIRAVEDSRGASLDRFIFALGIPSVGQVTARNLALKFGSFESLAGAGLDDLAGVEGMKTGIPEAVHGFFRDPVSGKAAGELARLVEPSPMATGGAGAESLPLFNQSIVFTGKLERITREEAEALARQNGARTVKGVSKTTSLVVVGENPGSKADKARKMGRPIIGELEFLRLVGRETGSGENG